MKSIPSPPSTDEDRRLNAALIYHTGRSALIQYVAEANREYFHWEKLRYRPTPDGLDPAIAWQIVKLSRNVQRRKLPLCDARGQPFSYWLPETALAALHRVDRWGGTSMPLGDDALTGLGPFRDRVILSSLTEEAIATSQIEGAVTTRVVAKEMLRSNRPPRNRSEQMILNSFRTIQMLRQRLDRPLSIDLLLEIQEHMTRDTLDDPSAAGRFRRPDENVRIVDERDFETVYVPPAAETLPERIDRLIEYATRTPVAEEFVHPLVKAAILHFWLAYEHPFVDGNGRTARAIFYWYMLKQGYALFAYLTISRVILAAPMQYYRSFLYSKHDDNDATYSVLYLLRATERALESLRSYLASKRAEQERVAAVTRRFPDLNERQRAVLDHALKHPAEVFTFQSHRAEHGVSLLTARADLLGLAKRHLLVATRKGRQRAFVPAADLAERLGPSR